uniref:Uncharacterized protein n=1 Tax=Picea glauca TaxID=3330 RepID=A0A101M291_PICGL|nr:hypothetical protein ABT39_MTgene2802 [Picea glauca]
MANMKQYARKNIKTSTFLEQALKHIKEMRVYLIQLKDHVRNLKLS